ncbi:acyltransferase [Waterburya agarophytonicola K14]|uniref:Acyltransferase n=1 Tax=Waterburya agarophytonicola KI4 TaxID=2874699 RepID=A0A964BQM4_9CYAN|nr:acyltransferase [Waterburya agarophytonicola]MCC0176371.1 acyltransferase [Waterburya agarophytonicola KI4]
MITQSPPKKKKFINSINYFRGLAIIIIVLGHSYDLAHWNISSNVGNFIQALSLNGTVYFVFISGFLYYHIFYHRFNYKKFMLKKAQYVLLPYILFSFIPILLTVFFDGGGAALPDNLRQQPFLAVIWYLATGKIIHAYWYIPMAILLFAVSPLVNFIIKSDRVLTAFWLLLPVSLIIHRPIDNLNAVHSLIYFFPVYLLGVWSSINNKKIYAYLKDNNKKIIIAFLAIALGLIQILVFKQTGNFHKDFWAITIPDVNLLQKILLCFLFMSILDIYEDTNFNIVNKVAETSFAIYFIHPFLINALYSISLKLNIDYQGNFFTLIITTFLVTLTSMAIALGIKAVLKKNSRYLIGW